ncbi:MAG: protein kinase [Victivallales bacterium]
MKGKEAMEQLVCRGCGGVMDTTGIEPFTLCECSACGTDLSIPLEMEYLRLEKFVGEKGIFKVYEGFDQGQNLSSVIYILEKEHPEYNNFLDIARKDAVELSTLKHPNICPILNFGEISGNFFVTEPKMDGYALSDYLPETQGLLDVDKVVDVLQATALGLAVAHHKEFVHHDLCPDNIHIDARGNVRTKNFFISRFIYAFQQHREDIALSVSPYFISPEKAESRVEDKRGDIFSFGVLFYYMLTGKYPFSGKSEIETVYSRIRKKKSDDNSQVFSTVKPSIATAETVDYIAPVAPSDCRENVPEEISSLVMDMLSYYPVKRPKFTEILATINLYKAKEEKEKVVSSAQKEMVRDNDESASTKTRAIPIMRNLAGELDKNRQKRKKFFKL